MSSKIVVRAKMLESRAQIGPQRLTELNLQLAKNLRFVWPEALPAEKRADAQVKGMKWAGYKSFRWEADPSEAVAESAGILSWIYPRVEGGDLKFYEPADRDARWLKNSFGIWEPDPLTSREISLGECVGILVPGVAFDRKGYRLGYGKGFYDRALAGFRGLKVGIGFSIQLVNEALPIEPHDVPVDLVVTDSEIYRVPG